jgi:hypothetical protein
MNADMSALQSHLAWKRGRDRRCVINLARYRAVQGAVELAANRHGVSDLTKQAAVALALTAFKRGDSAARAVSRAYRVIAEVRHVP